MNFEKIEHYWNNMQQIEHRLFDKRIPGFETLRKVVLTKVSETPEKMVITFSNVGSIAQDKAQAISAFAVFIKQLLQHYALVRIGRASSDKLTFELSDFKDRDITVESVVKTRKSKLVCVDVKETTKVATPVKKVIADAVPKTPQRHKDGMTKIIERRKIK